MDTNYSYEKLGLFYLGRELDIVHKEAAAMPLLFKSKNLTTHAAVIGMTGSGKTGLGIGLIEEAIMDNIPSIIIDPKGDMGNLLLTFPELNPEDFVPWVDRAEAEKKGETIEQYARIIAGIWQQGLASWGQAGERITALRQKTTFTIYTPGSSAGVPVSVLDSFEPPPDDVMCDGDTLNGMVNSVVSGLLSLVNLKGDSKSREYVLLSSLFVHFWRRQEGLDMEGLIGNIVNPPFKKVGVFALDVFYPQKERMELAMLLNSVLASPAFAAWTTGKPLDIQKILYDDNGKARTAIFSIAHLSNAERMFFVTMLLNRFIGWMRKQQGSSSLKAILYMDEIFGYFPPTANPPSKQPMLILLKQARAYGIGVILATQNPVDLDYKGLSNIGTWLIGRLQTSQDQEKVVDGIAGSSGGALEKSEVKKLLADLKGRQFMLRSAHLDDVILFETRWVMSYLKGPISLTDIKTLMKGKKEVMRSDRDYQEQSQASASAAGVLDHPPLISNTIKQQYFIHPVAAESYTFEPWLAASGSVRFYNAKRNIDEVVKVSQRIYLDERFDSPDWKESEENPYAADELQQQTVNGSRFYPLPGAVAQLKDMRGYQKMFADYLYHNNELELFRQPALKLESQPGETLADFKVKLVDVLREIKDLEISKIEEKYLVKQQRIEDQIERAMNRVEKEKSDVTAKTTDTILSFGAAVLGALFGRKKVSVSTISRASTGIKNAGRLAREKNEFKRAQGVVAELQEDMEHLAREIEEKTILISEKYEVDNFEIETFSIKPRRSDVFGLETYLLWEMVP